MLRTSFLRLAKLQIAIIGSGPSGCYTADHLIKKGGDNLHVDIYDRMPVPFGLVRYGVAPDHPEVKNVEDRFMKLLRDSGKVTWLGNVDIGRSLTVQQLQTCYDAVVFATGADTDNKLGIPREDLANIFSARTFVNYYNTMPSPYSNCMTCPFDMSQAKRAVIIGNGNVALDIARALATPYKHWCPTDMNCRAVRDLMNSSIEEIDVIARRGEEHAAFTTAEFREIASSFDVADVEVRLRDFDLGEVLAKSDGSRPRKRMLELMHKYTDSNRSATHAAAAAKAAAADASATSTAAADDTKKAKPTQRKKRIINFYFNLKPTSFVSKENRPNFVGGVLFDTSDPITLEPKTIKIAADVVFTSIGYRSEPVRGIPFDHKKGVIPNINGRVCHSPPSAAEVEGLAPAAKELIVPQMYCVGWVKRGPKGVILHAMMDAQETASKVLEDLAPTPSTNDSNTNAAQAVVGSSSSTQEPRTDGQPLLIEELGEHGAPIKRGDNPTKSGKYDLFDYLVNKEIIPVSIKGAQRVFDAEKNKGVDLGKKAEKIGSVLQMVQIAAGGSHGESATRKFRGVVEARPAAASMLAAFIDDETDMRPIAKDFGKIMPHVLANTTFPSVPQDKTK